MAEKNKTDLKAQAAIIRDETTANANTATRVGTMDYDAVDSALNVAQTLDQSVVSNVVFNKQVGVVGGIISFAAALTIDCDDGNVQYMEVTSNVTSITIIHKQPSHTYRIYLVQDADGGNTIATPNPATFGDPTDNSVTSFAITGNDRNIIDVAVDPNGFTEWSLETHTI